MYKKVINYLKRNKVEYELIKHKTVYNAFDLSRTLHINPAEVLKSVIVLLNNKVPVICALSADKKMNFVKFSHIVFNNIKRIKRLLAFFDQVVPEEWGWPNNLLKGKLYKARLADERWIKNKFSSKSGTIPPFGRVFNMPLFMDLSILNKKYVYILMGDWHTSIKISTMQYVSLERPMVGSFAISK